MRNAWLYATNTPALLEVLNYPSLIPVQPEGNHRMSRDSVTIRRKGNSAPGVKLEFIVRDVDKRGDWPGDWWLRLASQAFPPAMGRAKT